MKKNTIITIAGKPASGKSVTSRYVASKLGYQHFSSGDLFRAIGKERGVDDVRELNHMAERGEIDLDNIVDTRLQKIGKTEEQLVVDSRTAWHWMPASFKVYLDLDLMTAAERVLSRADAFRQAHEHIPESPGEYALLLEERLASETRRYKKLYDIDPYDASNYDLIVDTKNNSVEEVVQLILDNYRQWIDS